jgi:hypothetical protein
LLFLKNKKQDRGESLEGEAAGAYEALAIGRKYFDRGVFIAA